jgi:hypothetical protein
MSFDRRPGAVLKSRRHPFVLRSLENAAQSSKQNEVNQCYARVTVSFMQLQRLTGSVYEVCLNEHTFAPPK